VPERFRSFAYWRRLLLVFLAVLALGLGGVSLGLGWASTFMLTQLPCGDSAPPSDYGLPYETVQFMGDGLQHTAYFIGGDLPATVITAPPLGSDPGGHMSEIRLFHEAGLSVLAMGARTCNGGKGTFGYREGNDVVAAYAYLITRPDVDGGRVSVHGFSAAGAAALFAAAREPRLRAVSAMGNYHNFTLTIGEPLPSDNWAIRGYKIGAVWGYEFGAGVSLDLLKPIEILDDIAPRPILFIYGSEEISLPGGEAMFARAADHAELWIVPGVGHGGYVEADPTEAALRLAGFHLRALTAPNAP